MPLIDLALVNDVWTLKLSMIQTVGLAVITLFIGTWINKHSKFLQRYVYACTSCRGFTICIFNCYSFLLQDFEHYF